MALPELDAFLDPYADLFRRSPTRRSVERYVAGLLTDLNHKTCDTIAQAVAGTSTQRLHHLLADAEWESAAMDERRVRRLVGESPEGGILILDDTAQRKDGRCSVGVARQYSGTLGKVGNCQVIVTAEYMADELCSSTPLHWPVTARLYLPEAWTNDAERRRKANVPEDLAFQTKPEIALDLVRRARAWGVPFRFVVADSGYGDNRGFLEGLEEQQGFYVCAVGSTFGLRLRKEVQEAQAAPPPEYQGNGRPRLARPAPLCTARGVGDRIPEEAWRSVAWREGSQGTLRKQFHAVRVHRGTGNPAAERSKISHMITGPEGWLLIERPVPGQNGEWKWYFSNLPADTTLERLVALAHARWVIEQFYREAKGVCGLDNYQGRSWQGLHRHLALVMLSYSFLMQRRARVSGNPDEGFSPLRLCPDSARCAQAGAASAVPGPATMAHRHPSDRPLHAHEKLTKYC